MRRHPSLTLRTFMTSFLTIPVVRSKKLNWRILLNIENLVLYCNRTLLSLLLILGNGNRWFMIRSRTNKSHLFTLGSRWIPELVAKPASG